MTDELPRAAVDHLYAVAAIIVPDSPPQPGAALQDRVLAARETVERRVSFVDHMLRAMGAWEP